MTISKHALFCPVMKAANLLEPRWTLQILTEMWWGSSRFNDIRRGVPGISPTLLSKRLKELEAHGLVERVENKGSGTIDYLRTEAAKELEPIIDALGRWAYRNTDTDANLDIADEKYFVWGLRLCLNAEALPRRRVVFKLTFPDRSEGTRDHWLVHRPQAPVDACWSDPGFDVDLFVTADLPVLVSAFMGYTSLRNEIASDRISLLGDPVLARGIHDWLVLNSYARECLAGRLERVARSEK